MIKVSSFKISDSDGINKLLERYRLAFGAHILVSEGQVCVPYEDGSEPNNEQRIVFILEQKNMMKAEYDLLIHSQRVLEEQIKDIEGKIEELREQVTFPKTKEEYGQRKAIDDEIKRLENVLTQHKNAYDNNKPEVYRMEVNFRSLMRGKRVAGLILNHNYQMANGGKREGAGRKKGSTTRPSFVIPSRQKN